jgi:hypothetical protein
MSNKINPIPKNKKCRCGRKITHHHYLCDNCWNLEQKDKNKRRKAMRKNKLGKMKK